MSKFPDSANDLAAFLGCSSPYASQLRTGARKWPLSAALKVFDAFQHKVGPLEGCEDSEIETLRRFNAYTQTQAA